MSRGWPGSGPLVASTGVISPPHVPAPSFPRNTDRIIGTAQIMRSSTVLGAVADGPVVLGDLLHRLPRIMAPLCVKGLAVPVAVMVRRSSPSSSRLRLTTPAGRRVARAPGSGRRTLRGLVGGGRIVGADGSGLWPIRSADHSGSVCRAG